MSPDFPKWLAFIAVLICALGLWKLVEAIVWIATHVSVDVV